MSAIPTKGALHVWFSGRKGRVLTYTRPNARCPSHNFLLGMEKFLLKRFSRLFERFCNEGMNAANNGSFKPLIHEGKGLWAIKEHDHRLLCFRGPDAEVPLQSTGATRTIQQIVLLDGWVKDKDDSMEERTQILRAVALREECERCVDWTTVILTRPPKDATTRVREDLVDPLVAPSYRNAIKGLADKYSIPPAPDPLAPTPGMASKGPAQTLPKKPNENTSTATKAGTEKAMTESKSKTATMRELAELAGVPYKWLWRIIAEGHVGGFTTQKAAWGENKLWPWDGIESVVAKIQGLRKTGRGISRKAEPARPKPVQPKPVPATKPVQPTPPVSQPLQYRGLERLLTIAKAARLVGVSRGTLRKAVLAGSVSIASVRDGVRLFHAAEVRRWYDAQHQPSTPAIPVFTEPVLPSPIHVEPPSPLPSLVGQAISTELILGCPSPLQVRTKTDLRKWLDELLAGKREDEDEFAKAVKDHRQYRQRLERETKALEE